MEGPTGSRGGMEWEGREVTVSLVSLYDKLSCSVNYFLMYRRFAFSPGSSVC